MSAAGALRYIPNREFEAIEGTTLIECGTVQIVLACQLYGMSAVLRVGDSGSTGVIRVPNEDLETFLDLVEEKLASVNRTRPAA